MLGRLTWSLGSPFTSSKRSGIAEAVSGSVRKWGIIDMTWQTIRTHYDTLTRTKPAHGSHR